MFESKNVCFYINYLWTEMSKENKNLTDHEDIEKALKMAEYIKNGMWQSPSTGMLSGSQTTRTETLALYSLRKYRHLKNHYYPDS